ncbi:MAG: hypothetical protein SFY66_19740 [Oculatellaceae cyanobacterium bins.114]|nr:hypothetical protein [Oculatellaceae cyanobacterium bins.114]
MEINFTPQTEEQPPQQRNFTIPGCCVTIVCNQEEGIPVSEFLAIAFQLAHSNPDAKVDFWIKVVGE